MTRTDRKILFSALAFVAVVMRGKDASSAEAAEHIRQLSVLIEIYCEENVIDVSTGASGEPDAPVIDQIVERHINELRDNEETRLPEDRAMLIKLHDRLQQRKTRRTRRDFYAFATEDQLADLVLKLLDEEINDEGNAKLA